MDLAATIPVEYVSPDAPHDPPRPLNLPFGAVCAAVAVNDPARWPALAAWLVANGLHDNQLIAVPGIRIYRATGSGDREYAWYVVVDYQTGAVNPDGGDGWADAARGLQLNHEAGRCHRTHPRAIECALDRHARLVTVEPGEELRGAFTHSWTGTVYPPRTPWLDVLLDRPVQPLTV